MIGDPAARNQVDKFFKLKISMLTSVNIEHRPVGASCHGNVLRFEVFYCGVFRRQYPLAEITAGKEISHLDYWQ